MKLTERLGNVALAIANKYAPKQPEAQAPVLHSGKYGDFDLADPADRKRLKKVVIDLQQESKRLVEHDIADWRTACQMAKSFDNPNRIRLYEIYDDVALDLHLSGTIEQLNGYVKARSFKFVNEKGEEDEEAVKIFDQEWFKDLLDYHLEARYYGHSLIELGNIIVGANNVMAYDGVTLIPREHVVPEKGRIVRIKGEDWKTGLPYREAPVTDWLIESGRKNDLGLFEKAAKETIAKKYALAFWDTFAEMFGIPIRIAKTSTRDEAERSKMAAMMENMGAKAWGVFDDSTDIELVESTKSDAYNVYDKRVERANSELSKLVLNQTMTIDDGSSLSQSQTHLDVLENLVESICDGIRDMVNNKLLPRMIHHGFPVQGLSFEWDEPVDYTPEQQKAFEEMIVNHYEVPGDYFKKKYGVPAGKAKETGVKVPVQNSAYPFFE
jgi:hypothetical protein